jgi:predicted GNAT superfamily acetyltransferase
MTAQISELIAIEDLRELAQLFSAVWQRSGEPPIGGDILRALAHSGNYVAGARQDGRIIGGLVGWLGGSPRHELHLHSHILGVLPGMDAQGLGFALKQHQRRWCLERGVMVMEWTTDPLVRRNVYFNLSKLGARATGYLVNFYGAMSDGINAGEESDRLLVRWELDSLEAEAASTQGGSELSAVDLIAHGAVPILQVGASGEAVAMTAPDRGTLLCQIPEDIVVVRRSDPALARSWRLALRSALDSAFASGFEVTGATKSGWYVLNRPR